MEPDGADDGLDDDEVSEAITALAEAGIFDPDGLDADDIRWLLTQILRHGGNEDEIRESYSKHRLPSLMIELMLADGERLDMRQLARRAGVSLSRAQKLWRAFGFADPPRDERRFTERDVRVLRNFDEFVAIIGEEGTLNTARAIGTAMARIAEAEVSTIRSMMEAPLRVEGMTSADVWGLIDDVVAERLELIEQSFTALNRHQIVDIARRLEEWEVDVTRHNVVDVVVGFGDLVGFTQLAESLDLPQLDKILSRFEAVTGDVVAEAGATLVKRLGDAVLFVTPAPAVACRVALELVEAFADDPIVPPLRVGLAAGEVMALRGDYYGRPVNRASRVVGLAAPSSVLVTGSVRKRIYGTSDEFEFSPTPVQELQGVGERVQLWQLMSRPRRRRRRR